jgi:hypothetical protein
MLASYFPHRFDKVEHSGRMDASRRAIEESMRLLRRAPDPGKGDVPAPWAAPSPPGRLEGFPPSGG